MRVRFEHVACVSVVLLLVVSLLGFPPVAGEVSPEVAIAEYNYYFVAGHNMTPTPPSPGPSPPGFLFTADPPVYDVGTVYHHGGRDYLYDGFYESGSPVDDNAYVTVNITNNLGYDITIEDLTAEVTAGTPTKHWYFWSGPEWGMGNMTMIAVDTLDPWDPTAAISYDEVNYTTGAVEVHRDPSKIVRDDPLGIVRGYPDWFRKATGDQGWPYPATQLGPGSLLENDLNGDAAETGHVKPVMLVNGSTFTEYFGITVFGQVDVGTQINATITLRFTYTPPPEGEPAVCDVRIVNLVPFFPAFPYDTIEAFPEWGYFPINVTLRNWGTVPINVTVNAYYGKDGSWFQTGPPQIAPLDPFNGTALTFYWDLKASDLGKAVYPIKVNATATCDVLTATDEFIFNVKSRVIGDTEGDNDVDVADQRKMELVMFTMFPQQAYLNSNSFPLFTDMDGDGDIDVGDQRKQSLHKFESWPGPIWSAGISIYSPAGSIALDPPTAIVHVGQTITVSVIITNITDCAGYMMKIYYNPTILQYWFLYTFDTDPANPMSPTQMAPDSMDRIDGDASLPGSIRIITVWKAGVPRYSYAGSSVAAKITFKALTTGNARLVFDQAWTRATDNTGNDILFQTFIDGWVPGDVDGDRDVDVGDQRKVQLAMFSVPGDPNWNPNADLDGDGNVDVGDQRIQQDHMFESW